MDQQNTEHPKFRKPEWVVTTMAKSAAYYGVALAATNALLSMLPFTKKLFSQGPVQEAVNGAFFGSVIGAVFGAMDGVGHHAQHPLKVENEALRKHIIDLHEAKSFVERVDEKTCDVQQQR